jgi:hypothetical protein
MSTSSWVHFPTYSKICANKLQTKIEIDYSEVLRYHEYYRRVDDYLIWLYVPTAYHH